MSEKEFPVTSRIIASTSDLFPIDALVHVKPIPANRVEVQRELANNAPEVLFETDLDPFIPEEDVRLEEEFPKNERTFTAVITLCPGKNRKFLVGDIKRKGRIAPGGTGVWVAEEQGRVT